MAEPRVAFQIHASQPCSDQNPAPRLIPNAALTIHENDRLAKMVGVETEPPTPPANYHDALNGPPAVTLELVHDNPEAANGAKFKDMSNATITNTLAAAPDPEGPQ